MNILVFEDNNEDFIILKNCIDNLFSTENISYDLHRCNTVEELFNTLYECDLLFLDIEVNQENGIDIGTRIRNENHNCKIIIVSNYKKYLIDGYKIQAERYLLKPLHQEIFNVELKNVLWKYFRTNYGFYDKKISPGKILFKNIFYIESLDHKTRIHFTNGKQKDTTYPLSYWIEKIPDNLFGQPYRCYFINFQYIYDYKEKEIILTNDEIIPISRFYKSSFQKAYLSSLQFMI